MTIALRLMMESFEFAAGPGLFVPESQTAAADERPFVAPSNPCLLASFKLTVPAAE